MSQPYLLVAADFVKTGGMDRANFAFADYLARQGKTVHLVTHQADQVLQSYANVTTHFVSKPLNSYFLGVPGLQHRGRSLAQQLSIHGARVLVNGGNCYWGDINWVHYVHAAYCPNNQTGYLHSLKTALDHQISKRDERQALGMAKVVIANSERTKQHLTEYLNVPTSKIHCIYCGIDPSCFYPATPSDRQYLRQQLGWPCDQPMVIFIGALGDRRKGFDTLFAAWQQLCARPNWHANLVTIGTGSELPRWQQRTTEAGLQERIQFLGFRADVPDWLRAGDCLVAPTRYEAYGLGVHEALCCGLPAIVSASAGIAERYPEKLHMLLLPDPEEVEGLVARLQQWYDNAPEIQAPIVELSEQLRSYTWDDMAQKILETIHQLTA